MSQLSIVPTAISPLLARTLNFGLCSSNQAILLALKYGSNRSPVMRCTSLATSSWLSFIMLLALSAASVLQ